MSSTLMSEKMNLNTKTDILLAEKTLEIVRLVELADVIIRSKFNNDPTHWMDAMLRVLVLRNPAYLWEERNTCSESEEFCQKIYDNLFSMYSEMEAAKQNTGDFTNGPNYSNFVLTCSSLFKLFSKFSNLLVKTNGIAIGGNDFINDAKLILKNIAKFIAKLERDGIAKTSDTNEVGYNNCESLSVPPSITSTLSVESVRPDNNVASGLKNSKVPNTLKDEEIEVNTKSHPYNNPVFSTLNKKLESLNNDASSLFFTRKSSSVSTTASKPSRSLSEGDKSRSVDSLNKNLPDCSKIEATREYLQSTLGDESKLFDVHNNRVHCAVCDCDVYSLQNIAAHVTGKQHLKSKNAKATKPKSVNQPIATENIQIETKKSQSTSSDAGTGQGVLQISSTVIPVKKLEL